MGWILYEKLKGGIRKEQLIEFYKRYINRISKSYFSSYEILKFGDAYIELIEKFPCKDRMELCKREGYYIRKLDCVNKRIAGRSKKENNKLYQINNRDRIRAYKKKLNSIKYNCPCGGIYDSSHAARHRKTLLHREYLFNLHNELNHL